MVSKNRHCALRLEWLSISKIKLQLFEFNEFEKLEYLSAAVSWNSLDIFFFLLFRVVDFFETTRLSLGLVFRG